MSVVATNPAAELEMAREEITALRAELAEKNAEYHTYVRAMGAEVRRLTVELAEAKGQRA